MAGMNFKIAALALALVSGFASSRSEASTYDTYNLTLGGSSITGQFTIDSSSSSPSGTIAITALSLNVGGSTPLTAIGDPTATFNNGTMTAMTYVGTADDYKLDLVDLSGGLAYTLVDLLSGATMYSGTLSASATPLPSGLPLFISGLVALGFLGWRKKRMMRARDVAPSPLACSA
jgi:hypothetical protein